MTGARATRLELVLVYAALVIGVGLASARRARGWSRLFYGASAALALGSALALLVTPNPMVQALGRGATLGLLLALALPWAARPLRRSMQSAVDAIQFGLGLFVADQLAAFGIGDLVLIAWPDLARQNWPLAVVGELVQECCLLLVVGVYCLALPGRIAWQGLRPPGPRPRAWVPIVIAALQVEFGVLVLQLVLALALQVLHVDLVGIGNASFPAPGDWHPALPVAVLLVAVLPGTVEELVFRGLVFARLRASAPLDGRASHAGHAAAHLCGGSAAAAALGRVPDSPSLTDLRRRPPL